MSDFSCTNTEIYVPFLGLQRTELMCLKRLVESYLHHYSAQQIRFCIVDQSIALRKELDHPQQIDGSPVFPIHERFIKTLPVPDIDASIIQSYFSRLSREHRNVRVITLDRRLFHSQCVNEILYKLSRAKYVLLLDSDTEFVRSNFFQYVASCFPDSEWEFLTAIGSFVHGYRVGEAQRSKQAQLGWWTRLSGVLLRQHVQEEPSEAMSGYMKWRLPRLEPHLLLIHRDLVCKLGMDFRLMFLDLVECPDGQRIEHRVLGDCGASLVFFSAYHGLKVGHIDTERWVVHAKSQAWSKEKSKYTDVYRWW